MNNANSRDDRARRLDAAQYAVHKLNCAELDRVTRTRLLLWRDEPSWWFTPNASQRETLDYLGYPSGGDFPIVLTALYDLNDPDFIDLLFEQGVYPDELEWQLVAAEKGIHHYLDFFASTAPKSEIDRVVGANTPTDNNAPTQQPIE